MPAPQPSVCVPVVDVTDSRPRREFRTLHGYRRAFLRAGSGPALVLLHGVGDSSRTWSSLIPLLARTHTVIAPDLLGHGHSDKPGRADYSVAGFANGVRDLLEVLGIEKATLIGHSLGGGIAAQFTYQYPERVERLVLVSPGGGGREVNPLLRLGSAPGADTVLRLGRLPGLRQAGRLGMAALRALPVDLGHDAGHMMHVLDQIPDGAACSAMVRTLRAVVDRRGQFVTVLDRCYLAADVPTLVIWGRHDSILPVDHAHAVHRAIPRSRLQVFDNSGHYPHHCEPARFVAALQEFLAYTRPARFEADRWRTALEAGRGGRPSPVDSVLFGGAGGAAAGSGTAAAERWRQVRVAQPL